jgi:nucleoid-associated protein YgaU
VQDLAVLYDTDWQSILKANGIENPEDIKPGQKILIPAKKSRQ